MALEEEVRITLEEMVELREQLKKRIDQIIDRVSDPDNEKISQVRLKCMGGEISSESLILLTELLDRVNVTTYGAWQYNQGETFPFDKPFTGTKRLIEHGRVPGCLYRKLWRLLEDSNVWELKDVAVVCKDKDGHEWQVCDAGHYIVEVSKRDRAHKFRVELSYDPYYDRPFNQYRKIINQILLSCEFTFPPRLFWAVKSVQPILDEISREELRIKGYKV